MEKLGNYKLVITGHGEGMGKAIYDYYKAQSNYNVIGYDLKFSQNLHTAETYNSFISECKEATHIILNAHTGEQHTCLKELHTLYGNLSKLCIVFGSMASKYWLEESEVKYGFNDYWKAKTLLDKEVRRIQKLQTPFKITMIRPSWVDTALAKEYKGKKLTIDNVVTMVKYAIEYEDYIHFPTVELEVKE